jgi:parallel beta-helix repeat protein
VYSGTANNNIIRNNKIYENGYPGTTSFGIILSYGSANIAYNNIIYNNQAGITVDYNCKNCKVYNNTIYNNIQGGYAGIEIGTSTTGTEVRNNIIYNHVAPIKDNGTNTLISNNLTTDPNFINISNSDFRLQSTSPAINAGMRLAEVLRDFASVLRPQGTEYDVGAHEYRFAQPTPEKPINLRKILP